MAELSAFGMQPDPVRLAALLKLRKGAGMRREDIRLDVIQDVGAYDRGELQRVLEGVASVLPPWPAVLAIYNALNLPFMVYSSNQSHEHDSLTERREKFAEGNRVSVRTVIRWEDAGAIILESYVGRLTSDHEGMFMSLRIARDMLAIAEHNPALDEDSRTLHTLREARQALSPMFEHWTADYLESGDTAWENADEWLNFLDIRDAEQALAEKRRLEEGRDA